MVFLTRFLAEMPPARIKWYTREQICRGKDAIKDILPLTIMNLKNSARGKPGPGFKKIYYSAVFRRYLRLRVTLGTQRAIKHAGGFDRFIYYTPKENFKSQLALSLQLRMQERARKLPKVFPPPLDKRHPQPVPKDLAYGHKRIEVCDVNKYVYLG